MEFDPVVWMPQTFQKQWEYGSHAKIKERYTLLCVIVCTLFVCVATMKSVFELLLLVFLLMTIEMYAQVVCDTRESKCICLRVDNNSDMQMRQNVEVILDL